MSKLAAAALALAGCYVQPQPHTQPLSQPARAQSAPEQPAPEHLEATVVETGGAVQVEVTGAQYDLRYDWQAGDVHAFRYSERADIRASMGMAGDMSARVDVASDFDLKVHDVDAADWAHVTLTLRSFSLSANGRKFLTLRAIPRRARSVEAWISPRGEVVFGSDLLVVVGESSMQVVVAGEARSDRASATARATVRMGDQELTVAASVNVESGTVSGEARMSKRERVVRVSEQDATLDLLPRDLLRMIVLPEGVVTVGGRVAVTTPLGSASVTVRELGEGQLSYDTAMNASVEGLQTVSAEIRTTVTPQSDAATLTSVEGFVTMAVNAGGFDQTVKRTFALTRL